jgi:hypothetical protein
MTSYLGDIKHTDVAVENLLKENRYGVDIHGRLVHRRNRYLLKSSAFALLI